MTKSIRVHIALKSIRFKCALFFATYHVETTLKGISLITLTWFPHGSKKECTLKANGLLELIRNGNAFQQKIQLHNSQAQLYQLFASNKSYPHFIRNILSSSVCLEGGSFSTFWIFIAFFLSGTFMALWFPILIQTTFTR